MSTPLPPSREDFRRVVALVADKARAILPQAVTLVLQSDVVVLDDGTIEVGSSSDPLKTYRLEGTTCTCQDFQYGRVPSGWCAHRIAAGISKRVQELLPVAPPVEPWADNDPEPALPKLVEAPAPASLPEAPASVNVRIIIGGREVQWTLRDSDEGRLAIRLEELLQRYPLPQPQPTAPPQTPPASQGQGWCAIHHTAMPWNEGKEGRKGWWSHRLPEGQWCKGR
jgi:SWIM zinc finger